MLGDLIRSKKACVAVAGILAVVGTRVGLPLEPAEAESLAELITGIVAAYLASQGLADLGKHRPPGSVVRVEPPAHVTTDHEDV